MRSLQDAMYNWLSIKVVCDARPDDTAAMETEKAFYHILEKEHQVSSVQVRREEELYFISYKINVAIFIFKNCYINNYYP